MKSKKALARRAEQEALAQTKADKVEAYKARYREVFGFEPTDREAIEQAAASITLPPLDCPGGALTREELEAAISDHVVSPRAVRPFVWRGHDFSHLETMMTMPVPAALEQVTCRHPPSQLTALAEGERRRQHFRNTLHSLIGTSQDLHAQTVQAVAQIGSGWERFAARLRRDPINIPASIRPPSQRVDSYGTVTGRAVGRIEFGQPVTRAVSSVEQAVYERLQQRFVQRGGQWFRVERFQDMDIYTPCDPPEDV